VGHSCSALIELAVPRSFIWIAGCMHRKFVITWLDIYVLHWIRFRILKRCAYIQLNVAFVARCIPVNACIAWHFFAHHKTLFLGKARIWSTLALTFLNAQNHATTKNTVRIPISFRSMVQFPDVFFVVFLVGWGAITKVP
jgi:hypothetical protein